MYSLLLLSAFAIGLLLLGTTEKIEQQIGPLETIKSLRNSGSKTPEQVNAELNYRWNFLDQSSKDAFLRVAEMVNPGGGEITAKSLLADAQDNFYEKVYVNNPSVGETEINKYVEDEFVGAPSNYLFLKTPYTNALKSYFMRSTSTPAPSSTSTTGYASRPEISQLNSQYNTKLSEYNRLVDESVRNPSLINTNLEKIKALNLEMSNLLDQMIVLVSQSSNTKKDVNNLRDELVYKLQRIQRDYDGLLANTDKLETLRRIRQFEEKDWKRTVLIYLIIFLVLTLVLLLVMFFRGQKKDTATTTPMMAASTAPLT